MKIRVETILAMFVVASFALALTNMIVQGGSLTKDEAIEISRNTPIVQQALREKEVHRGSMVILADYWNSSYINFQRQNKYPGDITEKLPTDHGVWRIGWSNDAPGYHILHFIDELTGQILYERWFVA